MIIRLVLCFLLCFLTEGANAEDSLDHEFNTTQPGIGSDEHKQQLALHKDSLNNLLADIEKRYGDTAGILKQLGHEIERQNRDLIKIRSEIGDLKNEISTQNKELSGQIKSAYAMGQKEKLKLLLNQQEPGLSSRMMRYYHYLNKARITKLTEVNSSLRRLDGLEKEKLQETAVLEKNLERKQSEQVVLDGVRQQRNELLAQINDISLSDEEQLSFLLENENKLKNLIAGIQSSGERMVESEPEPDLEKSTGNHHTTQTSAKVVSINNDAFAKRNVDFISLKGKLPWPVTGRLVQKFGSPRTDSVWDGVVIDAKEGVDIRAVSSGKVVYSEWLRGYGLLTIIDHGQGYMTLYAFNQSLFKQRGETVGAGEVIASVGQSGGRTQSGLYFGIRKKGMPIDPLKWFKN